MMGCAIVPATRTAGVTRRLNQWFPRSQSSRYLLTYSATLEPRRLLPRLYDDRSTASRQAALSEHHKIDREFIDEGISGAVLAADGPGFRELLNYVTEGDTLHVYTVDRPGRDAIDVQNTVRMVVSRLGVSGRSLIHPAGRAIGSALVR
jgi:hypothetical protein